MIFGKISAIWDKTGNHRQLQGFQTGQMFKKNENVGLKKNEDHWDKQLALCMKTTKNQLFFM